MVRFRFHGRWSDYLSFEACFLAATPPKQKFDFFFFFLFPRLPSWFSVPFPPLPLSVSCYYSILSCTFLSLFFSLSFSTFSSCLREAFIAGNNLDCNCNSSPAQVPNIYPFARCAVVRRCAVHSCRPAPRDWVDWVF